MVRQGHFTLRRAGLVIAWVVVLLLGTSANASASDVDESQIVWVDVRSWVEQQVDHIDGDVRIHYTDIVEEVKLSYPEKSTPIRLYCAAGVRAEKAKLALEQAGYRNVSNAGGIDDVRRLRGL